MDTVETDAAEMMGMPYVSIGSEEHNATGLLFVGDPERPLSGYLAGKERGGRYVQALEEKWQEAFSVKHAIACNSATSGLMAAAFAAGLRPGHRFLCPAMTMSATAAAPMMTGATPIFGDVSRDYYALRPEWATSDVKAVFLTHLFGIAFDESWWAGWCRQNNIPLIVDAAQSPFAKEARSDRYAGTIGDIGVFSLNVHKHFHCGEGGVCVTDSDDLAAKLRAFINHAEHVAENIGLNLRMPEVCAAIAYTQLRKAKMLVAQRVDQALSILEAIGEVPGIRAARPYRDSQPVHYIIPFQIEEGRGGFCRRLRAACVPAVEGYEHPLYRFPAFGRFGKPGDCPVAEDLHDNRLFYLENCAWTFSKTEIQSIGDAFKRAAEA
jgi:dTDP-4-amino-4,6-dideoxygalactose transaminase